MVNGVRPHLCDPGDGAQVPAHLEESGRRWRGLTSEAGRTTLVHDEGFGFEETQQVWGFFTLTHSDLMKHTQQNSDSAEVKENNDND